MGKLYDYTGNQYPLDFDAIIMPEHYGAVGDGVSDDSIAFQQAVNNGGFILCRPNKKYKITNTIKLKSNTVLDLNMSEIISTGIAFYNFLDGDSYSEYNGNGNIEIRNGYIIGGDISFIHGEQIRLFNLHFRNALNDHFMEICACKDYIIEECSFIGMAYRENASLEYINIDTNASYPAFPHNKGGQNDPIFYDMSTSQDIIVRNCYFSVGSEDYAYGFNAIGAHARNVQGTYTENITITNNIIRDFSLCGIRVNAMRNAFIAENDIRVVGDGIKVGDVADCIGVVIKGNYIDADSGNDIALTAGQYEDLTVAYNVHDGMNDTH